MADDAQEIIGKWTVRVKDWIWEYEFSAGGKLTWRDTRSNERGVGRWALSPKFINLSWLDSATTESWTRPVTPARQKGWYNATYFTGNYEMQKVVAASPRGATDVNPSVANVPWDRYVDQFTECAYDVNYKVVNYFSTILQLTYADGTRLELDFEKDLSTQNLPSAEARDAMAQATVGRGGRIFPKLLTSRTVPRLWAARDEAFSIQNEAFRDFANLAVIGVMFVLMTPAMPAGAIPGEAGIIAPKATRRPVPGGGFRPPPTGWPKEVDFKTVQQVLEGRAPRSQLSRAQAQRAAEYYRTMAGQVKGTRAADAKAFNLERARFLQEGGSVPPGKLNDFVSRTR